MAPECLSLKYLLGLQHLLSSLSRLKNSIWGSIYSRVGKKSSNFGHDVMKKKLANCKEF